MSNIKEDLGRVKAFVFDVDGVLSTCKAFLHPGGEMLRSMNIKDGYALQYAVKKGYVIGIISGGDSESVRTRFTRLGVIDIYLKSQDKKKDFADFLHKHQLKPAEILYMGDDLPDYEVMSEVGFPACPADAAEEIKIISKYISHKEGGDGCVRDVIEQVLRLQGKWFQKDTLNW